MSLNWSHDLVSQARYIGLGEDVGKQEAGGAPAGGGGNNGANLV